MAAVPSGASAGSYEVSTCNAAPGVFSTQAFGDFATRGMRIRRACNPEGPGRRGLLVGNVLRRGRVPFAARSILTLVAPPATHFRSYKWSGDLRRRDCGYALQVYADGTETGRYEVRNKKPHTKCPRNGRAQSSGLPRVRNYPIGNNQAGPRRIVQRIDCRSRDGCSARGENFVRTFKGSAVVVDYTPPSVQITGGALASGDWVAGTQAVDYTAQDNVGVKGATAVVGRTPGGGSPRPCDYTRLVPCSNGPATLRVDTRVLDEGTQPHVIDAIDGAGNSGRSPAVTARIDNTPPARVDVAVEGGQGWRQTSDFVLAWANPPEGDRAPITAAHQTLCRAGTLECTATRTGGDAIARIGLTAPAPGEYTATVWREDAAGNQEADNASVPVTLRYDPEPPPAGLRAPVGHRSHAHLRGRDGQGLGSGGRDDRDQPRGVGCLAVASHGPGGRAPGRAG